MLTGDGALGYAVGELATVTELGLPITVVVLNNRSLGWIRWYRRITFGRGFADDDFADVAYADVARGFGMHGVRVTDPAELGAALASALGQRSSRAGRCGHRGLGDPDRRPQKRGRAGRDRGIWRLKTHAASP